METSESRHHRYIRTSTSGITVLEIIEEGFQQNPLTLLHKLVEHYNKKIQKGCTDYEALDVFYKVLCYEYQLRVHSKTKSVPKDFNDSFFNEIKRILTDKSKNQDEKIFLLLLDIMVLQMVLYCNRDIIKTFFQRVLMNDDERSISYKIIGCLIDALYLNSYLHEGIGSNQAGFTHISTLITGVINSALNGIGGTEWALLASVLTKLITTFDYYEIVPYVWMSIMTKDKIYRDHQEMQLTLLTMTIDSILLVSKKSNISFCSDREFWLLICYALTSDIEQQRKQGLYIMRKVLDFMEKQKVTPSEKTFIPFINCQRNDQQGSVQQMKTNFFLILECLEEKQAHLVSPALTHLETLIQGSIDHQACGNCFDRIFLRCVYTRILQHKTNVVIHLGLMSLLRMNPKFYDKQFITMLVQSLNNSFLYNNQSSEALPEVANELAALFIKAENAQVNLMNQFICEASKITWAPIPLFYVIESLSGTTDKLYKIECNIWTESHVEAVGKMVENNLKMQTLPLRKAFKVNIWKIFSHYAKQSLNLDSIARILSAFPPDEALIRGNKSWMTIANYVEENINEEDAAKYVGCLCEKLTSKDTRDEVNRRSSALMIILLYDAKRIFLSKSCTVKKALCTVFDLIIGADVRPYADTSVTLRTIELISCLLDCLLKDQSVRNKSTDGDYIENMVFPYLDSAQRFIFKSLKQSTWPRSYKEASEYVESFRVIAMCHHLMHKNYNFSNDMKMFHHEAIRIIDDLDGLANIRYWYMLHVLFICRQYCIDSLEDEAKSLYIDFLVKKSKLELRPADRNANCDSGRIISECYGKIAELIHQFFTSTTAGSFNDYKQWLPSLKNLVETGKEYVISSVIRTLRLWSGKASQDIATNSDVVKSIIDISWKLVWDLKKDKQYWLAMNELTLLLVTPDFLKIEDLRHLAIKHIDNLIANSENIPALRSLLLTNISSSPPTDHFYFYDALLSCLLHTNVGRTDKKIEMQTYNYLMTQYGIDFLQCFTMLKYPVGTVHIDVIFRAQCVLLLLTKVSMEKTLSATSTLAATLISILKNCKGKRYFANSNLHRIKHRVMQLLLLIQPTLDELSTKELHDTICDVIVSESNQPTVRVMQEWLLVKIYIDNPLMRACVWKLLELGKEKRPGSTISIASIIYFVSRVLSDQEKKIYVEKAIRKLLPCCFSQQFVVRLYCQVILSKIFDIVRSEWGLLPEHRIIKEAVHESLLYGNMKKNSIQLFDDFYFTLFDPVKDYNFQTIFYDMPRLLDMSMDEWIAPEVFQNINEYFGFDLRYMSIEGTKKLNSINTPTQVSKSRCHDSGNVAIDDTVDTLRDIQKKVTPWIGFVPISDDSSGILALREKKLADDVGMIIIASLIDGMPNLGGLSRTAEIFCARELILGSVKYIENKEFQSLSVSSEKWITVTEVKPHELRNYLLEKKSMGWELVGAEQTANSVSLLDIEFSRKTVLLLGNEKSGIPANLVPLMDVCVEIPQAGVVRSLNVHVTGAVCMWQYAKQHIFK